MTSSILVRPAIFLKVLMKHTDGKVTFIDIEDEDAILQTETGLKFKVPLYFIVNLDSSSHYSKTYREFIVQHLRKNNVYMPPDYI
jgi:hypothetical protein